MATRVLVEFLLFLTPFAVFLIYRAASREMRIRDRWPLTQLVLIGAGIAVAVLIITPLMEPPTPKGCPTPPVYGADGKVIPSMAANCPTSATADAPGAVTTPTPSSGHAPVAPRDVGDPTQPPPAPLPAPPAVSPTPPKPLEPPSQGG